MMIALSVGLAGCAEARRGGAGAPRPTPCLRAARAGHADTVKSLLAGGKADVNGKDERGNTPLIEAARAGHDDVVQALLVAKADASVKNDEGRRRSPWLRAEGTTRSSDCSVRPGRRSDGRIVGDAAGDAGVRFLLHKARSINEYEDTNGNEQLGLGPRRHNCVVRPIRATTGAGVARGRPYARPDPAPRRGIPRFRHHELDGERQRHRRDLLKAALARQLRPLPDGLARAGETTVSQGVSLPLVVTLIVYAVFAICFLWLVFGHGAACKVAPE